MIYRFKIWVYQPYFTEIFINANSDTEAGETLNSINLTHYLGKSVHYQL